jgi:hypothetical protein
MDCTVTAIEMKQMSGWKKCGKWRKRRKNMQDSIDKKIEKQKNYFDRHYNSKNILKRFVWRLLSYKTFYNIIYDVYDVAYNDGKNDQGKIEKPGNIK